MDIILKGGNVFTGKGFRTLDISISGGVIKEMSPCIGVSSGARIFNISGKYVFPGFTDVHVHLREPGFSYKETVATGTAAAAHGGFTTVCTMPNLSPVPDTAEHMEEQLDIIRRDAVVDVLPFAAITKGEKGGELSDMDSLAPLAIGFSDDGKGVQSEDMMLRAMENASRLGKVISAHCEDESLLHGGYIHDGAYAAAHGHRGICSESEWRPVQRDVELVRETGAAYHVCHVSSGETVEVIRRAKAEGLNVTCETGPHYLMLCDEDIAEDGRFKMNPPLRSAADREALIQGIIDGTVDMIATDHAPHSAEEKSRGLEKSAMGVVGLETAFAAAYTALVKTGRITLEKLVELMSAAPAARFGIDSGIDEGKRAALTVFDIDTSYTVDPETFLTKGRATPFAGMKLYGKCEMTILGESIPWIDKNMNDEKINEACK